MARFTINGKAVDLDAEPDTPLLRVIREQTICVAAPAVLNAFFNATGRRILSFPLKKHGITLV